MSRPRKLTMADQPEVPHNPLMKNEVGDWIETHRGVSVTWLMQAFRMDRQTVKKKLARCPSIGNGVGGQPTYDFIQAASYLVKPQVDLKEYVKTLRPIDLPAYLQDQFWASQLKRQQWEQRAGQLWKTEDVLDVFGETYKRIKNATQLWVDNLEANMKIDPEVKTALTYMVDALNDDIYDSLLRMPKERQSRSSLTELDEIENEGSPAEEDLVG